MKFQASSVVIEFKISWNDRASPAWMIIYQSKQAIIYLAPGRLIGREYPMSTTAWVIGKLVPEMSWTQPNICLILAQFRNCQPLAPIDLRPIQE